MNLTIHLYLMLGLKMKGVILLPPSLHCFHVVDRTFFLNYSLPQVGYKIKQACFKTS